MKLHLKITMMLAMLSLCDLAFAQDKLVSTNEHGAVFARPKAEVWSALIDALSSENIHPETLDQLSGVVMFKTENAWTQQWGGTNGAIALLTTKRVGRSSSWQAIVLTGNIRCKEVDPQKTEVAAIFKYVGYNGFSGWLSGANAGWQQLDSNGYLERFFIKAIESRLPDIVTRPGAVAIVQMATQILESLHKVDAAFKIEADSQTLSNSLIDSQARVDDISAPFLSALPRFASEVKNIQRLFVVARKQDDWSGLLDARDALDRARRLLDSYREMGVETLPDPAIARPVNQTK